jgi:hypothetical protein
MKKRITEKKGIISLNEILTTEFLLTELEIRLETDPLLVIDLFADMTTSASCSLPGQLLSCVPQALINCTNTSLCTVPEANVS